MHRHLRFVCVIAVAMLASCAGALAQGLPTTVEGIVAAFAEVAMTVDYAGKTARGGAYLTRWEKPLTWTLLGDAPEAVQREIAAALERGASLTAGKVRARYIKPVVLRPEGVAFHQQDVPLKNEAGMNVALVLDTKTDEQPIVTSYSSPTHIVAAAANVTIFYGDAAYLAKIGKVLPGQSSDAAFDLATGKALCLTYTWTSKARKDLAYAVVMIVDRLQPPTKCIAEEIGHVLGIVGHFREAAFSTFTKNTSEHLERWTAFDEAALRLLYDPALAPGMSVDQVTEASRGLAPKYFANFLKK